MIVATKSPIVVAEPHTPEWYAARLTGIGASEAAAACGLSEYSQPRELYHRKRGEIPDVDETAAMRLGISLEPAVRAEFVHQTGLQIAQSPMPMYRSGSEPFVLATPDALLETGDGLETKTTTWRMASRLGAQETDEVPTDWLCQVQQQMYVMNWTACHIGALIDGRTLKRFCVGRHDGVIEGILSAERELWERIQNGDPPPINWSHSRAIELVRELHQAVNSDTVSLSDESVAAWAEYERLGAEIKTADARRDQLKARVLAEIGNAGFGDLGDGYMIKRSETIRKSYTVAETSFISARKVKAPK
jgi:putative phage-type endonuclease